MTYMNDRLASVVSAARHARLAAVRRDSAIATALLEGATQVDVARAAGVTQPAISQVLARRRSHTLGASWTIPVLAAHLEEHPKYSVNEVVRACAQFSSDFRTLADPLDQEIALGAPQSSHAPRVDALIAGLADYEAWHAHLATPAWTISHRYSSAPSWILAPVEGLKAWVIRHTPPQFAVRGVYLDARDLDSV